MEKTSSHPTLAASFLTAVLENLAEGVVACDANGVLTTFNRATREFHGLPEQPLPAEEWAQHYNLFHADGKTLLTREEVPLFRALRGEVVKDVEMIIAAKDKTRLVLCNGQAIYDSNGIKLGAVVAMHDITAIKAAAQAEDDFKNQLKKIVDLRTSQLQTTESALIESEKRFRTLFEQSPLSVQLLAVDGRTLQVNSAWKKLWNLSDELVQTFILPEYNILKDPILESRGVLRYIREGFAGKPSTIPAIYYDASEIEKSARGRWVEGYLNPILNDDGNVAELVLIHNDVTEKVESEKALQKSRDAAEEANRLKSSFLANMSHEIRTPLSSILGYTELLRKDDIEPEDAKQFLNIIQRSGATLTKIIDDILDISKVEAGRLEIKTSSFNLMQLLEDTASLLRVQLIAKSVSLIVSPIENPNIESDQLRLRQILVNLIGNAIKFTESGHITVATTFSGSQLKISVEDTGIGIPTELQRDLFQPFNQADNSYTRQFSGTGLGLALSKRLAQAMGGDVVLERSIAGSGSVFSLTLPFKPAEVISPAKNIVAPTQRTSEQRLDGVSLLLVDDSKDNRLLVNRVLTRIGAKITEATNGREAVDLALKEKFDLILMDIQMPIMDGIQATVELRSKGYNKPIIALTAHALGEERDRCLGAGANAHVVKPVNFALLTETILEQIKISI